MDRDPFGHRKYHGLYFVLGFLIAVVAFMMLSGCERGVTDKGRDCVGFAGMTIEGEQCEVIVWIPEPTDPPGCWYPGNTEYCEPEPPVCCQALIPSCMACADSCTVDAWLEKTCGPDAIDAEYAGWDNASNEPLWLCQAEIIN